MSIISDIRAKGEVLKYGGKEINLVPLNADQLLEVQESSTNKGLSEEKRGMNSLLLLAVHSVNNGVEKKDDETSIDEMKKMPTDFLMDVFKKAVKINKLESAFDFQVRGRQGHVPNGIQNTSVQNTFQELNQNPAKKLS